MNKLTTEHKKLLVEKGMGYSTTKRPFDCYAAAEHGYYNEDDEWVNINKYNPDQDSPEGLSQFVELIGRLDKETKRKLEDYLCNNFKQYILASNRLEDLNWLCSHKYEVCMAIYEVIN